MGGLLRETGVSSPYLKAEILKSFPVKVLALESLHFPLDDESRLKSHLNSSVALALKTTGGKTSASFLTSFLFG